MALIEKPNVLMIQPPVYDFALYDLYFKPYGLYRLSEWFSRGGYGVTILDCLDWLEEETVKELGEVTRKHGGTGKFPKVQTPFPFPDIQLKRRYHRYGILKRVIRKRIRTSEPDLVCITSGMTYWYQGVWEVIDMVMDEFPAVPIAVGGIYATLMSSHIKSRYPEVIVVEGDDITKFTKYLKHAGLPVPGSVLDPFPPASPEFWRESAVLRLNRGCPLNCDYCASRALSSCFVPGNPSAAVRWLENLFEHTKILDIAFYDDALLIHKNRVLIPFLEEIIKTDIPFRFYTPNGLHITELDRSTAELMKLAGFQEIRMGFESSSDTFHEQYDRKSTKDLFHESVEAALQGGFSSSQLRVYVLAGLPGQEADEVEESVRYASDCSVSVSVAEYSPVPGTALWKESCMRSPFPLETEPLFHNNTIQPLAWEKFSREDMQKLKHLAKSLSINKIHPPPFTSRG